MVDKTLQNPNKFQELDNYITHKFKLAKKEINYILKNKGFFCVFTFQLALILLGVLVLGIAFMLFLYNFYGTKTLGGFDLKYPKTIAF